MVVNLNGNRNRNKLKKIILYFYSFGTMTKHLSKLIFLGMYFLLKLLFANNNVENSTSESNSQQIRIVSVLYSQIISEMRNNVLCLKNTFIGVYCTASLIWRWADWNVSHSETCKSKQSRQKVASKNVVCVKNNNPLFSRVRLKYILFKESPLFWLSPNDFLRLLLSC